MLKFNKTFCKLHETIKNLTFVPVILPSCSMHAMSNSREKAMYCSVSEQNNTRLFVNEMRVVFAIHSETSSILQSNNGRDNNKQIHCVWHICNFVR